VLTGGFGEADDVEVIVSNNGDPNDRRDRSRPARALGRAH
jgi:hypothetical protein